MRGSAVTCNGTIYFIEAKFRETSKNFEYSPAQDGWTQKAETITPGWNVNLACVEGNVYAIGGDPFLDRNEVYNPKSDQWKTLSPMPTPRQHSNCCVVDSKIYVIGGLEKGDMRQGDTMRDWATKARVSSKNEVYEPKEDKWELRAPLTIPRQGPGLGVIDGKIYAIGGAISSAYDSPPSRVVEVYDVEENTWKRKSDFPIPITAMGVISLNNTIYVVGGQTRDTNGNDIPIPNVYYYDVDKDAWLRATDLPAPVHVVSATALDNGIYVIGGCDEDFKPLQRVWYSKRAPN